MNLLSIDTLPNTGEVVKNYGAYIGIAIILLIIIFLFGKRKITKMNKLIYKIKILKLKNHSLRIFILLF